MLTNKKIKLGNFLLVRRRTPGSLRRDPTNGAPTSHAALERSGGRRLVGSAGPGGTGDQVPPSAAVDVFVATAVRRQPRRSRGSPSAVPCGKIHKRRLIPEAAGLIFAGAASRDKLSNQ
ncbi:hypothetical protein Taro_004658 [Colocasia esculenta]|uniref:Uncharacterized protein n=1 Tax=Colocasia esculenta TaxID=4460 RepID=A0A843TS90_COLES|nr:hypothetical protein [Colocasia esculenta]